jgi:hypothetical protein
LRGREARDDTQGRGAGERRKQFPVRHSVLR